MANSLNFLNKPPATPAKSIGPQPKPSTAAPKSPFLDTSNPWAIPGRSTPAPAKPPKTQTPAKAAAPKRSNVPSTGYSYTSGSNTGATPQQRAREVDQAQMAAQATAQRRARERQAAQQAAAQQARPIKVQAREFGQPMPPAPPPDDGLSAFQRAQGYSPDWQQGAAARVTDRPVNPYIAQQQRGAPPQPGYNPLANQQAQPWNGAPPAFYDPEARFAEWQANQPPDDGLSAFQRAQGYSPDWQQAAAARVAARPVNPYIAQQQRGAPPQPGYNPLANLPPPAPARANIPATGYNYTDAPPGMTAPAPQPARPFQPQPLSPSGSSYGYAGAPQPAPARVNVPSTGYNYTDAPPGMTAPAPQPGAGTNAPAAPNPQARGPFYGYAPPGPLVLDRRARIQANLQPGQLMPYTYNARPLYTNLGARALMSDEALAIEDVRRQRDAAGGIVALQTSGMYRPWSSYSPAEKYYLRYGVMPQGEQAPPDTSGIAAMEASRAQTQRLVGEYKDTYGRYPKWDSYAYRRPDQQPGAVLAGTATAPGATAPAAGAQAQVNNAALAQVNPAAVRNGAITNAVTENDVSVVARQILQRYRPELPADSMTFTDIIAILSEYAPPQDRAAMYNEDAAWLSGFLASE